MPLRGVLVEGMLVLVRQVRGHVEDHLLDRAGELERRLVGLSRTSPYAARDIDRGIKAGRFHVDDRNVALIATAGALLGVMRAVLQGRAGRDTADHHAALVLRMLGLSADDAAEVAARPLPEVSRP